MSLLEQGPHPHSVFRPASPPSSSTSCSHAPAYYKLLKHPMRAFCRPGALYRPFPLPGTLSPPLSSALSHTCASDLSLKVSSSINFLPQASLPLPAPSVFPSRIYHNRTSLVVQWLRICLPMQGTLVRALLREYPTCHGATKPVCHSY